jgi:hypothetical protein
LETPGEAPPAAETFEGEAPRKDAEERFGIRPWADQG